jgi:P4 family phage/plasmid primase-like protien
MSGPLFDEHHRELVAGSAISEEIVAGRGYRSISRPRPSDPQTSRNELRRAGIPKWAWEEDRYFPGLLIPLYRPTGERVGAMWKPRVAVPNSEGKLMKYAATKGRPAVIDVHPVNKDRIVDPNVPLWITEGVKKADSLTSRGLCTIALSGVYNWRSTIGSLGDWEDVVLTGRHVTICYDADARTNPNVLRAMVRFGNWLKAKGVKQVHYLITPETVNGTPVKGADDWFAAGGSLDDLRAATTTAPPREENTDDTFTDSRLADTIADEVFDGEFCWAAGMGWLRWSGQRWARCTDVAVGEAVRRYSLGKFTQAVLRHTREGGNSPAIDGWRSMLSAGRQRAVTGMAKGIVERDAAAFDRHPDLLNTPTGVVDLENGDQYPHDPDLLITKMTGIGYQPNATHPDWEKVLTGVPDEVRDYLQVRLGQGITGHMPPDDVLCILTGGGENGKTTLQETIAKAIGEFYLLVSDRALMGNPDAHPTELVDFMGARYAVLEETPEARRLDPQRLKRTVGTPRITARRIRQDDVTFEATHSLFISTNHRPVVDETDHGTWRRLQLITFPYRFRKPHEALEGSGDRRGDPGLRDRCKTDPEVWAAALAWLVGGARKWYAAGKVMPEPPGPVKRDTRAWRAESDLIMAYLYDRLVIDKDAHVISTELLADFNEWVKAKGHQHWSDRTFNARFGGHDELAAAHVERKRMRYKHGLSRPPFEGSPYDYKMPPDVSTKSYWAWVGVRFATTGDIEGALELSSENAKSVPAVPTAPENPESPHERPLTEPVGTAGTREILTSIVPTVPASFVPTVPASLEPDEREGPSDEPLWPEDPGICPFCGWPFSSVAHYTNCESS